MAMAGCTALKKAEVFMRSILLTAVGEGSVKQVPGPIRSPEWSQHKREGYFLKHWPVENRDDGVYLGLKEGGGLFGWLKLCIIFYFFIFR